MPVAVHPLRLNAPLFKRLQQCATGLAVVLAVTKAAMAEQIGELDKARLYIVTADVHQAEFTDAR